MSVADQRATQPEMFQKYKIVEIMPVAHNGGVAYYPDLEKPVAGCPPSPPNSERPTYLWGGGDRTYIPRGGGGSLFSFFFRADVLRMR